AAGRALPRGLGRAARAPARTARPDRLGRARTGRAGPHGGRAAPAGQASDLTRPDLTGPDLTGPDLTGPDLTGPDLTGPGRSRERVAGEKDRAPGRGRAGLSVPIPSIGQMDAVLGPDGLRRCPWGASTPDYIAYHDTEWGRPVRDDGGLYERLC